MLLSHLTPVLNSDRESEHGGQGLYDLMVQVWPSELSGVTTRWNSLFSADWECFHIKTYCTQQRNKKDSYCSYGIASPTNTIL